MNRLTEKPKPGQFRPSFYFQMTNNFPDLFGNLPSPKRGRGRPQHVPTPQTRAKVARLLIAGAPKVAIARELKITLPTLRLHYLPRKTGKEIR
jgi:hypothetical protein